MTKEQLQSLYDILSRIHSDFLSAYQTYRNGRNRQIRADSERQVDNAISLADNHICKHSESYELLTGGDTGFIYDEFLLARYFGRDMGNFLNRIKVKIESLE